MGRFIFAPEAEADLNSIWVYIAEDSVSAANNLIALIKEKCRMLADSPMMGRVRNELAPSLRSFPVGRYVIFYRAVTQGIEIVRVLHSAQDIPSQDFGVTN